MKIVIAPRAATSRKFPITLDLQGGPSDVRVDQVKAAIENRFPQLYVDRQRLTFAEAVLETGTNLSEYGIKDGDSITFKDLGNCWIPDLSPPVEPRYGSYR